MRISRLFAVAILFSAIPLFAQVKAPVPSPAAQDEALKLVREVYKEEYDQAKTAEKKEELARELLDRAAESADLTNKYALLRTARDISIQAAGPTAFEAVDAMAETFQIDPLDMSAKILKKYASMAKSSSTRKAVVEKAFSLLDQALAADKASTAELLGDVALSTARDSGNAVLQKRAVAAKKNITQLAKARAGVAVALETLKVNPADPQANLAVGKYYCLTKSDWKTGLPMLAKGSDPQLRDAAAKDLAAASGNASAQSAAADAWYMLSESADEIEKPDFQVRACSLYQKALPGLKGMWKIKAEKRIAKLQPVADAQRDTSKMWRLIRKAMRDGQLKRWKLVGGAFSRTTFEEIPKDGAILVGFQYTTINEGRHPGIVQPIFRTERGEMKGRIYGTVGRWQHSQPTVTKAKPGYAVGAIFVRGGGGFDAFQPIFMKITETGLDLADQYRGTYVGGQGGGDGTLGGDGNFIVGIHGKIDPKIGKMESLSVVSLTTEAPTIQPGVKPVPGQPKKPRFFVPLGE